MGLRLQKRALRMERPKIHRSFYRRVGWNDIPQKAIDNLFLSTPRRCRDVINNRGFYTKLSLFYLNRIIIFLYVFELLIMLLKYTCLRFLIFSATL